MLKPSLNSRRISKLSLNLGRNEAKGRVIRTLSGVLTDESRNILESHVGNSMESLHFLYRENGGRGGNQGYKP